ncbi:Dothistromin biosynthesis peroxidase [Ophiocordyceps camponoti-floridani]|uniref:Dothistromin biosynthesis peroxidase n=1 Tax=Ophiocordyceps camponoti-floridani TaxID=2030778 RepID=A0A8H4VBP2_9HYPO|nr:Dothistromin biosynthesis peroxidase [Ophiocordyceps camponoti-floridani]
MPVGYVFIPRLFSNHSADFPQGYLDAGTLKSFYAVSGEAGNLTYEAGHERIPHHWYRRHPLDEYDRTMLGRDVAELLRRSGRFGVMGGNTGEVDSFAALNVSAFTRGVFTRETLAVGVNAACLPLRVLHEVVRGKLGEYFEDPEKPYALLTGVYGLDELGCARLKGGLDFSALDEFPGAKLM